MYQEIYIFLQSLNLDAVYAVDPLLRIVQALIETCFSLDKSFFYLAHALLLSLSAGAVFYLQQRNEYRNGARFIDSLLLSVFLLAGLFILDGTGLIFLDILPLLVMVLTSKILSETMLVNNSLPGTGSFKTCGVYLVAGLVNFWALSISGPLAFFYAILSLPFAGKGGKHATIINILFVLLAFFFTFFYSQRAQIFDYPRDAQLVPFSDFTSLGSAIIGPDRVPFPLLATAFIEIRASLLADLTIYLLPILLCSICFHLMSYVYINRPNGGEPISHTGLFLKYNTIFLVLAFTLLATFFIPSFSSSPEGIFFRVIPGLVWRPYPALVPGVFLVYALISINMYLPAYWKRVGMLIGTLIFFSFGSGIRSSEHRIFVRDNIPDPLKEGELNQTPSFFLTQVYRHELSGSIVRGINASNDEGSLVRISQSEDFYCKLSASKNIDDVTLALDRNYNTRWSTKGPQREGDWFKVVCSEPVAVKRIALSIVNFRSDFPRGIVVRASLGSAEISALDYPDWFGPVRHTGSGLPYFGPQGEVIFDFPEVVRVDTFEFSLRKGDNTFDWSIGEVLLWQ